MGEGGGKNRKTYIFSSSPSDIIVIITNVIIVYTGRVRECVRACVRECVCLCGVSSEPEK